MHSTNCNTAFTPTAVQYPLIPDTKSMIILVCEVLSSIKALSGVNESSASLLCPPSAPDASHGTFFKSGSTEPSGKSGFAKELDRSTFDLDFVAANDCPSELSWRLRARIDRRGDCDPGVVEAGLRGTLRLSPRVAAIGISDDNVSTAEWNDGAWELAARSILGTALEILEAARKELFLLIPVLPVWPDATEPLEDPRNP